MSLYLRMEHDALARVKEKYRTVFELMTELGVTVLEMGMREGKLHLRAVAPSLELKNRVWDQIMTVDPLYPDVICEVRVDPAAEVISPAEIDAVATHPEEQKTYVVQQRDTLRSISHLFYGTASGWERILEANQDQIDDPERLEPGMVLLIPALLSPSY